MRGHVLCVPPFNEEMNRCRSMVTLLARALSAQGLGTLVLDLYGTGDSEGDYAQARWSIWLDDLRRGMAWLDAQPGGCRVLWGLRLGAILAAELHAQRRRAETALMLWQPVLDGKVHLNQFLRVRVAAQIDLAGAAKETTASMRATLAKGEPIEVAGYALHPELTEALDRARLAQHVLPAGTPVLWLENAVGEPADIAPPSRAAMHSWPGAACRLEVAPFAGAAFWQAHERLVAEQAVSASADWCGRTVAKA